MEGKRVDIDVIPLAGNANENCATVRVCQLIRLLNDAGSASGINNDIGAARADQPENLLL